MRPTRTGALMVGDVVTARYDTPFKEVVRLLDEHRISGLPVIDENRQVIGVISETDLVRRQMREPSPPGIRERCRSLLSRRARHEAAQRRAVTAGGVMSTPAVTVQPDAALADAAKRMITHRVERLPVVDEKGMLVGIVTRGDLLRVFRRTDDEIQRDVQQQVIRDALCLNPYAVEASVGDGVVTLTGQLERRSEIPVAVGVTRRLDGVVGVVDRLSYRLDDRHPQPAGPAVHGVADDWLRKL
ncbi:CBS domain-containing protein [Streptomyces sp. NBC_00365]|uniref:CBS domain-containing protein n=1 Tax=Streptomyces sp. NBC_00365 TaxID=2975726 RepID=UPI002251A563|nr:CBS domain-containing protein [Streptomyces sp. NBC_00365]MCX5097341.1 CBS domain-containing protein [Streptomyces sp. NBC_00365]